MVLPVTPMCPEEPLFVGKFLGEDLQKYSLDVLNGVSPSFEIVITYA